MQLPRPFRGIIPPIVTPLLGRDLLDVEGLERLVEHQVGGGVHGIFVLGTTGEGPSLSYRVRQEMMERTIQAVDGRIPVLVGVTDAAYGETLRMTEIAARAGASAVVLAPPFYFSTSQSDLLRLVEDFAAHSPLPVFLYNIPEMTKVSFTPQTVSRAAEIPNIYGYKDSSGDIEHLRQVLAAIRPRKDFTILLGPERLLAEGMRLGADGGVHGGANLIPSLYVRLFNACVANESNEIERLQEEVAALGDALYDPQDSEYRYIRGLKYALSAIGICSDLPSWPFQPAGPELRQTITQHLQSLVSLPA